MTKIFSGKPHENSLPHRLTGGIIVLFALLLSLSAFTKETEAASLPARRIILVGDSRTEGMYQFVGKQTNVIWSYKSSMGLTWMKSTGIPRIESKIRKNTAVVILMGVNDVLDLWQADNYASYINSKAKTWKSKGAETYYVSLTPVDDTKDKYEKNKDITAWNTRIKKKLSSNVYYVDIYKKMKTGLETTSDGLHYQKASSVKFYNLVYDAVKTSRYDPASDQTNEEYYKLVYNHSDYMKYNSDIRAKYRHDADGAFEHFLNTGMAEGRQASSSFDPVSYRFEYKYLRKKYGNDWKKYYLHYIQSGYAKKYHGTGCEKMRHYDVVYNGVSYKYVYDYNYYIEHHPAVFRKYGYDDTAVLKYFVTNAMARGSRGNEAFYWKNYQKYNSDLAEKFGSDIAKYYVHYTTEGYKEKRRIK